MSEYETIATYTTRRNGVTLQAERRNAGATLRVRSAGRTTRTTLCSDGERLYYETPLGDNGRIYLDECEYAVELR